MNLYEYEGKQLFHTYGITIPQGINLSREERLDDVFSLFQGTGIVIKAQVLSGKRGKNNAIRFMDPLTDLADLEREVADIFSLTVRDQYVAKVRVEEKIDIASEQYLSITYDTNAQVPVLVYSAEGGVDIEDVAPEKIETHHIPIDTKELPTLFDDPQLQYIAAALWQFFVTEDARLVEINPLVQTTSGEWIAADAKVALDDDAGFRHKERKFESRTMLGRPPTEREIAVANIDEGEKYYQGTAGKYIEMDGDIAILFSGGGASIANMDALMKEGLQPSNYTEYSGNPPREKVYALTKIVLSKPGLRGLWIAGGVANFTDVAATFQGIVDALDEIKPTYSIVVRRAGPNEAEGMALMQACADRNNLNMQLFGKEQSMSETAAVLAEMVTKSAKV